MPPNISKMKKLPLLLVSITFLISCGKEDPNQDTTPYGPEAGKQALEDNMISALNDIDAFRNDPAMLEIEEFAKFMLENEPASKSGKKIVSKSIGNVLSFKTADLQTFSKAQLAAVNQPEKNLQADFDDKAGTWTWNTATGEFEQSKNSSDKIIYKVTQNNKNAVLTISNFSVLTHPSGEQIPTSVNAVLTVDGSTIFSQVFSASFPAGKYIPQSVSNTTTLGGLTFTTNASNNASNTETNISTAILLNGNTLIGATVKATGSYAEIDNTGDTNNEINTLVNTISASYTMLNATISMEATSPTNAIGDLSIDEAIALANENLKVTLSVNNKKIADGEFYKQSELEDDRLNLKFVFEDGSKSTIEAYFDAGFDQLQTKADDLFINFENLIEEVE